MQINNLGEWVYYGKLLLKMLPDATLWDLLKVMYTVKTKNTFPINDPDDVLNKMVNLHMEGWPTRMMSKALGINAEHIYTYLVSMGFTPWRNYGALEVVCLSMIDDWMKEGHDDNVIRDRILGLGVSKYKYSRIKKEHDNAKSAGF